MFTCQLNELLASGAGGSSSTSLLQPESLSPFLRSTPVQGTSLMRVGFVHMQAARAVERRWLATAEAQCAAHGTLASYFAKQYETTRQQESKRPNDHEDEKGEEEHRAHFQSHSAM